MPDESTSSPPTRRKVQEVLEVLRLHVQGWKDTAVAAVADDTDDPFAILVSCIISLRTRDAVTEAASRRLFALARTPQEMGLLNEQVVQGAIYPCAFYRQKAAQIGRLSELLVERHGGKVPSTLEELKALPGVGLKTASLVLSFAYGQDAICVDTHVHRIPHRLGWTDTATPEQTEAALRKVVPQRYWKDLNLWMVPFGQRICQPVSPRCSICPLRPHCLQKGVRYSR